MDVSQNRTSSSQPSMTAQEAHRRQTEWVRASLLACPKLAGEKPAR